MASDTIFHSETIVLYAHALSHSDCDYVRKAELASDTRPGSVGLYRPLDGDRWRLGIPAVARLRLYYPGRRLLPAPLRAFGDFIKSSANHL
jgi:hypothetical protein